jgi:hypothetical protein
MDRIIKMIILKRKIMHITNLLSQYFGKFAKKEFPRPIQEL